MSGAVLFQSGSASILWGILVPALIFVVAFAITWKLYRHFSGRA